MFTLYQFSEKGDCLYTILHVWWKLFDCVDYERNTQTSTNEITYIHIYDMNWYERMYKSSSYLLELREWNIPGSSDGWFHYEGTVEGVSKQYPQYSSPIALFFLLLFGYKNIHSTSWIHEYNEYTNWFSF